MLDATGERSPATEADAVAEIRTTFPRRDAADACAADLVAGRFAACVQVEGPIRSAYRWHGAVETTEEFRCVCKTTPACAAACTAAIRAHHEYENPEVLTVIVTASADYAAWVRESVLAEPDGRSRT